MKKALAILLLLSALLGLVSCNGSKGDKEEGKESLDENDVVIASGGSSEYAIVWKAGAKGAEKQAVMDLSSKITETTGAALEMKIDLVIPGEDATLPEKALYVGKVGYENVKSKWSALGENDYTVTEENGNVYVMGGSEIAIYYAMLHFKNSFINMGTKSVTVPTGYSYVFEGADSREDYVNNPQKLLMNWISEFETPNGMLDFEEKKASLANPNGRMMAFAHRGDMVHYPDNSIEGIISAWAMGVDCVEIDVVMTKDGVPILFHDEYLNRMTNFESVKGTKVNGIQLPTSSKVSDWTFEQIRCLKLKEGSGGDSAKLTEYIVPSFEEALKVCNDRLFMMVDKIADISDMRTIILPTAEKLGIYECIIFCGGMSQSDAYVIHRDLKNKGVAEEELPTFLGRVTWKSNGAWENDIKKMEQGGMASFLRISGLDSANDCMWYLDYMEEWLLSVKGKVRWQFDSQLGGGVSENATVWDRAYELGVDTMMVNDPLKLCKYIAQKHFS